MERGRSLLLTTRLCVNMPFVHSEETIGHWRRAHFFLGGVNSLDLVSCVDSSLQLIDKPIQKMQLLHDGRLHVFESEFIICQQTALRFSFLLRGRNVKTFTVFSSSWVRSYVKLSNSWRLLELLYAFCMLRTTLLLLSTRSNT